MTEKNNSEVRSFWRAVPGGWVFICAYRPCSKEMNASDSRRVIGEKNGLSFCSRECECRYEAGQEEFVCQMGFVCRRPLSRPMQSV